MSFTVQQARALAQQWVNTEGVHIPGFVGAFLHGSINWLPDEAILAPSSDVDVKLVADGDPSVQFGKFVYQGLLLEVSPLPGDLLESPESILGYYQLAGSFAQTTVLADPAGRLSRVQAYVAQHYAQRHWVRQRCDDVRRKIERDLAAADPKCPFAEQIIAWLFGTGKTAHLPLVAGLKNPTVRRRYVALRELLRDYGYSEQYESMLALLGGDTMTPQQVSAHLEVLTPVFDATGLRIKSAYPFASDLKAVSRPLAIGGSQTLIEQGLHREALFWIAVTYTRCLLVLLQDAPAMYERFLPGFHDLLADMGIGSEADVHARKAQALSQVPQIWALTEDILAANPAIRD